MELREKLFYLFDMKWDNGNFVSSDRKIWFKLLLRILQIYYIPIERIIECYLPHK